MPETMTRTAVDAKPEEMNPYAIALEQLASVAAILGLDDDIHAILQKPKRELTVNFPVNMESGGTRMFTGYRVQHNTSRGPAKGGDRRKAGCGFTRKRTWMKSGRLRCG